jgi:8-oxo-dGTP pyrophosphatase MutT (NUDIX family)
MQEASVVAIYAETLDAYLILRRSSTKEHYPSYWDIPGGGVQEGESPEWAGVRELIEEVGFCPPKLQPLITREVVRDDGALIRVHIWWAKVPHAFNPHLSREHEGAAWRSRAELQEMLDPMIPSVKFLFQTPEGAALLTPHEQLPGGRPRVTSTAHPA